MLRARQLLIPALLTLAGCGGSDEQTGSAPSATSAPTATATATVPPTPTSTPTTLPTATATAIPTGEAQPGGGGDEGGARIPVAVTVESDGTIFPQEVSVPAFFALELQVRNRTASTLTVRWNGAEDFTVGIGKVGIHRVAPVKRGRYPLEVAGLGRATVVVGGEPGP